MLPFPLPAPPGMGVPPLPGPLDPLADPALGGMLAMLGAAADPSPPTTVPKPVGKDVLDRARKDQALHRLWLTTVVAPCMARYEMEGHGAFEVDRPILAKKEMEGFRDPSLRDEVDRGIAWLAGHRLAYKPAMRRNAARAQQQQVVDFLHLLYEEFRRQYEFAGRGDLDFAIAGDVFRIGRVASLVLPDADDPDVPYTFELLDATTTFPSFDVGKKGPRHVSLVRRAVLAEVVGRYDDPGDSLADRLYGTRRDDLTDQPANVRLGRDPGRVYEPTSEVSLVEWFDRGWRMAFVDEIEVMPATEHYCGEVPITYVTGNLGTAGHGNPPSESAELTADGRWTVSTAERPLELRIARQGLPHIWASLHRHDQTEAVLTRLYNEIRLSNNRPKVHKQGPLSNDEAIRVDMRPGASTPMEYEDELIWPPTAPEMAVLGPVLQTLAGARSTNLTAPMAAAGQMSASAVESIQGVDHQRFTHAALTAMQFWRAHGELVLRLHERLGHALGSPRGEVYVPRRRRLPHEEPGFALTPEAIAEVGHRVEAVLTNPSKADLAPLGNAANLWTGMKAMSRRSAMELRDEEDPEAEMRDIEIEEFYQMPEMKMKRLLDHLEEIGDGNGAALVAELLQAAQTERRGPGGPGGPNPSMPNPGGGPQQPTAPAAAPGLPNLGAMGLGPGSQGGQPGPNGPTGPQAIRPESI